MNVAIPDSIQRSIVGFRVELEESRSIALHSHRKAELLYSMGGSVTVVAQSRAWLVQPGNALWIPGGIDHMTFCSGPLSAGIVFFALDADSAVPRECQLVSVQPLMRELVIRSLQIGHDGIDTQREERLAAFLLDELVSAREQALQLPFPSERRLQRLAEAVMQSPSRHISLREWGLRFGIGERTLTRLFHSDMGMGFARWRQHLHVQLAIPQLVDKRPVGLIAYDLGYESTSAFIAMFKRIVGSTPGRFE